MANETELRDLVGKKCWFADGVLEIRQRSDAEIVEIANGRMVLKHFLGAVHEIPLSEIRVVTRKDR